MKGLLLMLTAAEIEKRIKDNDVRIITIETLLFGGDLPEDSEFVRLGKEWRNLHNENITLQYLPDEYDPKEFGR